MQLDKFVIGLVIFFVMITASTMIISDIDSTYRSSGTNMSVTEYMGNLTVQAETQAGTYGAADTMHTKILGEEVDPLGTGDSMFLGSFKAIKVITTPIGVVKNIMVEISNELGIDPIFTKFAFIALMISILFTIVYIVFRISKNT